MLYDVNIGGGGEANISLLQTRRSVSRSCFGMLAAGIGLMHSRNVDLFCPASFDFMTRNVALSAHAFSSSDDSCDRKSWAFRLKDPEHVD